eukprot:TRINITY_DN32099_c0_g1_i1.p1 TRINITY_DN32099_c0_g1~~TRINITY_DN32099_c0_g1_i1.p1  ORF type:complete len:340 (-),score=56.37 TRINITY_DN32099_c0_g1_i1:57-1076(-)
MDDEDSRGRSICAGCDRPASVCLCAFLPQEQIVCPCEVVLLQHPKERKQKNRSAWIAERCITGVRTVVGRRLSADRRSAPSALARLWETPERCAVVFPGAESRPLEEVAATVQLLVFLDATWRFAQEMLRASPALKSIVKVEIQPPLGASPQFLVRKPMMLRPLMRTSRGADDDDGTSNEDGEVVKARSAVDAEGDLPEATEAVEDECGAAPRWGFCTAEAVALAVDSVCAARICHEEPKNQRRYGNGQLGRECTEGTKPMSGRAWGVVAAVVRGHVEMQLSTMVKRDQRVKHRPERPGYVQDLYEPYRVSSGYVATAATTASASFAPIPSDAASNIAM